jgi:CHAT domain-containing protein/Tfp pilus assembly protein PilF
MEYSPQGVIGLTVESENQLRLIFVFPGIWNVAVRPHLSQESLLHYDRAMALSAAGDFTGSVTLWNDLLAETQMRDDRPLAAWLQLKIAEVWRLAGDDYNADRLYAASIEQAKDPKSRITLLILAGNYFRDRNLFDVAEMFYRTSLSLAISFPGAEVTTAHIHYLLASMLRDIGKLDISEQLSDSARQLLWKVAPHSLPEALILNNLAILARERGDLVKARKHAERGYEILQEIAPESREILQIIVNLGNIALYAHDLPSAETHLRHGWSIQSKLSSAAIESAAILNSLSKLADAQGNRKAAEEHLKAAYEIYQRLDPNGLKAAQALTNLGVMAFDRGDYTVARDFYGRAVAIQSRTAPESLAMALTLSNLGIVESQQGNLSKALELARRAYEIRNHLAPKSKATATSLLNLGALAEMQGKLDVAWNYHRRSLAIFEAISPDNPSLITNLTNLGGIAIERGEYDIATDYLEKALRIAKATGQSGHKLAPILGNLGNVAYSKKDLDKAELYYNEVFKVTKQIDPNKLHLGAALHNLGTVAAGRGEAENALGYFSEALAIANVFAPDSLAVATELNSLGILAAKANDHRKAIIYHERALAIIERLAPGAFKMASSLHSIASAYYHLGDIREAINYLKRAIESLERQVYSLGGSRDTKAAYFATYRVLYSNLIELLVLQGRNEEALELTERSKARQFAAMLRERDLLDSIELSTELNRARRLIKASYDRLQVEVESWSGKEGEDRLAALIAQRQKLYREQEDLVLQIRQDAIHFAAARYPQPLTIKDIQSTLEPGTLAVFYNVGSDEIYVFAICHEGLLATHRAPYKEALLRHEIASFRSLLGQVSPSRSVWLVRRKQIHKMAVNLYSMLLGPVSEQIQNAKRVAIIPDGPLHSLPWGVLMVDNPESETGVQYLSQWKPVHIVLSAAVYSQAKAQRRGLRTPDSVMLAAFGAPSYRKLSTKNSASESEIPLSSTLTRALNLSPLPATRAEVESLVGLFPGMVRVFLGSDATEENAKSLPRNTRIVHFATHATLDERSPLDSAVVLSIPEEFEEGKDNGLLQAWEIFERFRVDADLVVLSACESGLGKEMGGEGLIGLTRAFQYAGARSVMASLWKISDRTTAELMVRFYKHLKAGLPKDEALRAAQMELIRGPIQVKNEKGDMEEIDTSAPYYWAAFQIYGDWQ